jgi:hypothetical protein
MTCPAPCCVLQCPRLTLWCGLGLLDAANAQLALQGDRTTAGKHRVACQQQHVAFVMVLPPGPTAQLQHICHTATAVAHLSHSCKLQDLQFAAGTLPGCSLPTNAHGQHPYMLLLLLLPPSRTWLLSPKPKLWPSRVTTTVWCLPPHAAAQQPPQQQSASQHSTRPCSVLQHVGPTRHSASVRNC